MKADLMLDARHRSADQSEPQEPQRVTKPQDEWVVALRSEGGLPPLFCVCAGGGDVLEYDDLAQHLPAGRPVYGFGVPPLEAVGHKFPTVQELAAIYVGEVRKLQPNGPYHLCGHSFGGIVVYEMAVLLANAGEAVGLVALIDSLHPAFRRNMTTGQLVRFQSAYVADRIAKYARNLRHGRIDRIGRDVLDFVLHRCKRTLWKVARLVLGRLRGPLPGPINSDEMILVSAWNRYESTSYDGRVVLLNAVDRPPEYGRDHTLGWNRFVTGDIDVLVVPGDHYSIMHPPDVQTLVERIDPYLAKL
jgi:thioesterase domain-containing protein